MVALGWLGHIEFSKQPIQPATEPDLFFYDVGVNFTSFRACERIQPYAEGSEEKEPGFEIRYLHLSATTSWPVPCSWIRSATVSALSAWE